MSAVYWLHYFHAACTACTDLHIGVFRTAYRTSIWAYVSPKPETSKVGLMQVMMVYGGCRCIAPLVLNLDCRRYWAARLHPRLLYSPQAPPRQRNVSNNWIGAPVAQWFREPVSWKSNRGLFKKYLGRNTDWAITAFWKTKNWAG